MHDTVWNNGDCFSAMVKERDERRRFIVDRKGLVSGLAK